MATVASFAPHIKKGVPMIGVPDVVAAIEWYVALGFTEVGRFDDEGEANFGMVRLGDAELMFNLYMPPAPDGVSLWLRTDRIDAIYERIQTRRRGTTENPAVSSDGDAPLDIEQNLEDMFYGARQFAIRDLNGYSVYFIQPLDRA
jgi:catechol 2,3-dioxygenase-like lactoylglutathione lyase family enzyme